MGPDMDRGAVGWLLRHARKNFWKVKHVYDDSNELIQEGYLCWYRICERYSFDSNLSPDDPHYGRLMNLFKITFVNRIRELSMQDKNRDFQIVLSRLRDIIGDGAQRFSDDALVEHLLYRNSDGDPLDESSVERAIIEASEPARTVLRFLVSEEGKARMRRPFRLRADGTRETTNERLRRWTGVPFKGDLRTVAKTYLLNTIHQL